MLLGSSTVQPLVNDIVFNMNELVIHTYQFIRLYIITCYSNKEELPSIDLTFILYCMRVLGVKTNLGGQKIGNSILMENLVVVYENELKPLLNHIPPNLKNTTQLIR